MSVAVVYELEKFLVPLFKLVEPELKKMALNLMIEHLTALRDAEK